MTSHIFGVHVVANLLWSGHNSAHEIGFWNTKVYWHLGNTVELQQVLLVHVDISKHAVDFWFYYRKGEKPSMYKCLNFILYKCYKNTVWVS